MLLSCKPNKKKSNLQHRHNCQTTNAIFSVFQNHRIKNQFYFWVPWLIRKLFACVRKRLWILVIIWCCCTPLSGQEAHSAKLLLAKCRVTNVVESGKKVTWSIRRVKKTVIYRKTTNRRLSKLFNEKSIKNYVNKKNMRIPLDVYTIWHSLHICRNGYHRSHQTCRLVDLKFFQFLIQFSDSIELQLIGLLRM